MSRRWLLGLCRLGPLPLAAACLPDFDVRTSLIDEPRLLAVRAGPAEARPGARVVYELLAVTPRGRDALPAVTWNQCSIPRPAAGNSWTAPARPGPVFLWVVLRDSRGGSVFVEGSIDVE